MREVTGHAAEESDGGIVRNDRLHPVGGLLPDFFLLLNLRLGCTRVTAPTARTMSVLIASQLKIDTTTSSRAGRPYVLSGWNAGGAGRHPSQIETHVERAAKEQPRKLGAGDEL
ncbi:hypothetical protein SKAU_G00382620 [Synaphobranchus kaupii]|uniref:Uncharacterized protein n=1 Tax=Synaphobranchus kaupii TaxID=118154 RepID=A0A9Q1EDX3_SYNKA|nr:hypothetical protein SKAU_G00382620 [Synaphobranchus kaupii]